MKSSLLILIPFIHSGSIFAQDIVTASSNDSLKTYTLNEIHVYSKAYKTAEERDAFEKLKQNTLKAYPYALLAAEIYQQIKNDMEDMNRRKERKKYVNEKENELRQRFEKEIRNMTRTQGEILIQLINRNTGNNCYQIVKEMKGGFTAFFWNIAGKMYDHHLKADYVPSENPDLELVIRMIENGQLQVKPIQ